MRNFFSRVCAGVLPLAYGEAAGRHLQAQFAGRLVRKDYICLCEGPSLGETTLGVKKARQVFVNYLFFFTFFAGSPTWLERSLALTVVLTNRKQGSFE